MSVATGPLAVAKEEGDLGKAGTSLEGSSFWKVVFAEAVGEWKRRRAGARTWREVQVGENMASERNEVRF